MSTPTESIYLYDRANKCIASRFLNFLEKKNTSTLFFIDNILDSTKDPRDPSSGPLSSSGKFLLKHLFNEYGYNGSKRVVMLNKVANVVFANEFDTGKVKKLMETYNVKNSLGIQGRFIGFDRVRGQYGIGSGGELRKSKLEVETTDGYSRESNKVRLILEMVDLESDQTLKTVNVSSTISRSSKANSFSVAYDGLGVGVSSEEMSSDGIHNVQENMLSTALFLAFDKQFRNLNGKECLYFKGNNPVDIKRTYSNYENSDDKNRIILIQNALNSFFIKSKPRSYPAIPVTGILDIKTKGAIRFFEKLVGALPYSENDYGLLYLKIVESTP